MTNIRFRRGNKADLPALAASGLPLWCEDTKELYIGTDSGVTPIVTNNNYFLNFVPYCLNSGNSDSNGYADIINKVSDTEVSFKVGSSYPNIGVTFPNGNHYTISSIPNLTNLTENGTYIFIIEEESLVKLADGSYSAIATAVKLAYSANEASPVMTSNTQNGFTCWMENDYNPGVPLNVPTAYYLMDKNAGTSVTFTEGDQGNSYSFIVKSETAIKINRIQIEGPGNFGLGGNSLVSIYGSNNSINWTSIANVSSTAITDVTNENYYTYHKFKPNINLVGGYSQYNTWLNNINFWYPVSFTGGNISEGYIYPEATLIYTPVIPTMTSNNSGGFIASGSAIYGGDYYKPFDGITGDAYPLFVYGSHNYVLDLEFNASKDNIAAYDIKHWDNYIVGWRIQFYYGGAWHIVDEQTGKNITATTRFYLSSPYSGVTKMRFSTAEPRPGGAFGLDLLQLYQTVSAFSQNGDYHTLVNQIPYKSQKRINGSWVNREYLKFGEDTKTGGIFGIPKSYAFNRKFYKKINCPALNTITDIVHNLGTTNIKVSAYLICKSAEGGYSVGQKTIPLAIFGTYANTSPILIYDANTIRFIAGSGLYSGLSIVNANGSAYLQPTPANWDLEVFIEGNF